MSSIFMIPAILLLLVCALLVTAVLRAPSKPSYVLSIYLCIYADVVLSGEIGSMLRVMNDPWAMLGLHALLALTALVVWWRMGRPSLWGPFAGWRRGFSQVKNAVTAWPELSLLGLGVVVAYATAAVLIVVVPPNNNDSMSTHLSRIGYWLQYGSFSPWPTSRILELVYPVNAQLQMFWTVLFWRSDALVGFMQWFAALASAAAVFGLARWMGWSRAQAGFAGMIYLGFPLVLLQATTTQNDLAAAALFVPTVFFFLLGLRTRNAGMLLLSALSLALGLGTKQSCFFLLPGLVVLFGLLWLQQRGRLIKPLLMWGLMSGVCFLLFGAYLYAMNWAVYHSPFGPDEMVSSQVGGQSASDAFGNIGYNVPRLLYQALDVSGLPNPLDGFAYKAKAAVLGRVFKTIGFQIEGSRYTTPPHVFSLIRKTENQEDQVWYGPLGWLLLFPCMAYQLVMGVRKREPVRVALVVNAVLFLVCDAWLRPGWDPFQGRYFAPVVALNAPLLAGLVQPAKNWRRALGWLVVALALVVMTVTMLYNPAKPLAGKKARNVDIWTADRVTVQTIQGFFSRDVLRMVERVVPKDATMGLYTPSYVWDYPFFGKNFERKLVPVYPFERSGDVNWLNANGVQYMLVQLDAPPPPVLPKTIQWAGQVDGWVLYKLIR